MKLIDSMKTYLAVLAVLVLAGCASHSMHTAQTATNVKVSMSERWKKAVIHLEGAADKESAIVTARRRWALGRALRDGEISREEYERRMAEQPEGKEVRLQGTALFVNHRGRRYLVTARHVLWDETTAGHLLEEAKRSALEAPEAWRAAEIDRAKRYGENAIFSRIFRVPSFDEAQQKLQTRPGRDYAFLLAIGAGGGPRHTFSSPQVDVAVVALDQQPSSTSRRRFVDDLINNGYSPIDSVDIADGPSGESAEVFTVGYPGATSVIGQMPSERSSSLASSYFSLPVFSFGKVAMQHKALHFFWADMTVFPGNSGGPVVENDRLIGIVSAQAVVAIDGTEVTVRVPFTQVIKGLEIKRVLDEQAKKDDFAEQMFMKLRKSREP